jgi:hypothetical protein
MVIMKQISLSSLAKRKVEVNISSKPAPEDKPEPTTPELEPTPTAHKRQVEYPADHLATLGVGNPNMPAPPPPRPAPVKRQNVLVPAPEPPPTPVDKWEANIDSD